MLDEFGDYLASTRVSETFASTNWFVPAVQTVHILGIAVVLATVLMRDMALLGFSGGGGVLGTMTESFLRWTWRALLVLLLTGVLLVIAEPKRELSSMPFRIKMLLVALLAITTLIYQAPFRRDPGYWAASPLRRRMAGAVALVSIALCICIVTAGRFIAYADHA
jgi:hypothetical protein